MNREFRWVWNGQSNYFLIRGSVTEYLQKVFDDKEIQIVSGSMTATDPGIFYHKGKKGFVFRLFR